MSFLVAVTSLWLQLLLFYCPTALTQSCWNAAEDSNGECHNIDSSCERDHAEQSLGLCATVNNDNFGNFFDFSCEDNCLDSSVSSNPETSAEAALLQENSIEILPIETHSIDIRFFSINLTWHHSINFTAGYKISIYQGNVIHFNEPLCICGGRKNIHLSIFEYTRNMNGELMRVEIEALISSSSLNPKQSQVTKWPTSCLDTQYYNSSTCASAILDPPQNITALEACEENPAGNLTIKLSWTYFSSNFAPPSHYYIRVFSSAGYAELLRFIVNGTTQVFLQLPNVTDYQFNVKGYKNCSGGANYSNYVSATFGCGMNSDSISLTRCPTRSSPTTGTTTTSVPLDGPPSPFVAYDIIGGCLGATLLLALILIVLVTAYFCFRKRKTKIPLPKPVLPSDEFSVFVMHTPQENSMKSIQTYVVCPLREFFNVATSGDKMCGDWIEWIELQVRQRSAVLLVFTKAFFSEWEGKDEKSQVVQAAQRLITSAVAQEILDKYAIIVLDEDVKKHHIPDNHFLKSMRVYVLGKSKNEIEGLYRFVTKTKSFEHQEQPEPMFDSFSSSFDFASYSTDSTNVATSGTPLSSTSDVPGDHHQQQSKGGEDTSSACCDSNLQKDMRLSQNLLQVLQAPSSPNHAGEFA